MRQTELLEGVELKDEEGNKVCKFTKCVNHIRIKSRFTRQGNRDMQQPRVLDKLCLAVM